MPETAHIWTDFIPSLFFSILLQRVHQTCVMAGDATIRPHSTRVHMETWTLRMSGKLLNESGVAIT